jgi:hypothetical protein
MCPEIVKDRQIRPEIVTHVSIYPGSEKIKRNESVEEKSFSLLSLNGPLFCASSVKYTVERILI